MVLPDMQGIAAKGSLGAPFVTLHNCTCIHITCDWVVNSVFHGVFLTQYMVFLSLFEGSLPWFLEHSLFESTYASTLVLLLLLIHFLHLSTYDFLSLCCLLLALCFKLTGSMMMNQVSIFWQLRFESQLSILAADLWHLLRLSFFSLQVKHKTPEHVLEKHDQVSPFIAVRIMLKEGQEGTLCLMKKIRLLSVLVPSDWHHLVKVEQHCILSY